MPLKIIIIIMVQFGLNFSDAIFLENQTEKTEEMATVFSQIDRSSFN
jgi:hypothetical protein